MSPNTDFPNIGSDNSVQFALKLVNSEQFKGLFREGMGLVEQTANYLDGQGRIDSRELPRMGSIAYATESMRLTTRLMQLASWLLLQRAVNEGEMTIEQAGSEKNKIRLHSLPTAGEDAVRAQLPEGLLDLIDRSLRMQTRIQHLDDMLYGVREAAETDVPVVNSIHSSLNALHDAFKF